MANELTYYSIRTDKQDEINLSQSEWRDAFWLALHLSRSIESEPLAREQEAPSAPAGGDLPGAVDSPDIPTQPPGLGAADDGSSEAQTDEESHVSLPLPPGPDRKPPQTSRQGKGLGIPGNASQLPQRALERALRPLLRRMPSSTHKEIDVEASIHLLAETLLVHPASGGGNQTPPTEWVLRPAQEKWLDVGVLYDQWPSMALWRPTVDAFVKLLQHHGAFRSVSSWTLSCSESGEAALYTGLPKLRVGENPYPIRALAAPGRRRLLFVLTDFVGPGWYDGRIADLLAKVSSDCHVVLVHMLPRHMWPRTAISFSHLLPISLSRPEEAHAPLVRVRLPENDPQRVKAHTVFPIVQLTADSLQRWSRAMVVGTATEIEGVRLPTEKPPLETTDPETDAKKLLHTFLMQATPEARQLAGYLAACPILSLPLMELIRSQMLKDSDSGHLAEVVLSGLLYQRSPGDPTLDWEQVRYGFRPGVRELLVDSLRVKEAVDVLSLVFPQLSDYIAEHVGKDSFFNAVVINPALLDIERLMAEEQPFAGIASTTLKRLGWRFRSLTEYLEKPAEQHATAILAEVSGSIENKKSWSKAQNLLDSLDWDGLTPHQRALYGEMRRVLQVEQATGASPKPPVVPTPGIAEWKVLKERVEALQAMSTANEELTLAFIEELRLAIAAKRGDQYLEHAGLLAEVEDAYADVCRRREELQKTLLGDTSIKRAKDYRAVIHYYRDLISRGQYEVMDFETTGIVDSDEQLGKALRQLDEQTRKRIRDRIATARSFLDQGNPEEAKRTLQEAQALRDNLSEIDGVAEALFDELETLATSAEKAKDDKAVAIRLIESIRLLVDEEKALENLYEAKTRYPAFPQIDEDIRLRQKQIIDRTLTQMRRDYREAQEHIYQNRFDDARAKLAELQNRGANRDFVLAHTDYHAAIAGCRDLGEEIAAKERRWQLLSSRIENIDRLLRQKRIDEAQQMFEALRRDHPDDDRDIQRLRGRLAQFEKDGSKWQEADRAFQREEWALVLKLCEPLQHSATFGDQARTLQTRTFARQWGAEAKHFQRLREWEKARDKFEAVVQLQGLPLEDHGLISEARQRIGELSDIIVSSTELERTLDDLDKTYISPEPNRSDWNEWNNQLKALEHDGRFQLLTDQITARRQKVLPEWKGDALIRADRALTDRQAKQSSEIMTHLAPLVELGAIDLQNYRYRYLAYYHHRHEAERLERSTSLVDRKAAIDHRQALLRFTTKEDERRTEYDQLVILIQKYVLDKARQQAVALGPAAAITSLEEGTQEYQNDLYHSARVQEALVNYALLDNDFEKARRQARTFQHLKELTATAKQWIEVIELAGQSIQSNELNSWDELIDKLVKVWAETPQDAAVLREVIERMKGEWVERIRRIPAKGSFFSPLEQTLHEARINGLVVRLQPDDSSAKAGVERSRAAIVELSQELNNRVSSLLRWQSEEIDKWIQELREILSRVQAILSLQKAVAVLDERMSALLKEDRERITRQVSDLQQFQALTKKVDQLFYQTMSESWDSKELRQMIEQCHVVAKAIGAETVVQLWQIRVDRLDVGILRLKDLVSELRGLWAAEEFTRIRVKCDEIIALHSGYQVDFNEPDFVIPGRVLAFVDTHRTQTLMTLSAIGRVAETKQENLLYWEQWEEKRLTLLENLASVEAISKRNQEAKPPCLSVALDAIREQLSILRQLNAHINLQPSIPLSTKAHTVLQRAELGPLQVHIKEQEDEARKKGIWIEGEIRELDPKIQELRRFMGTDVNFTRERNRKTFRDLAQKIQQVDGCHPELVKLIASFEKRSGVRF